MNIYGFHHTATLDNCDYNHIHHEYLNVVKRYGFLDAAKKIYICVVGSGEITLPYEDDKIEVIRLSDDVAAHEIATTAYMQEFCRANRDTYVWKSHSCGIKSGNDGASYGDPKYPLYRYYQYHQLFVCWETCLDYISGSYPYDVCGPELLYDPVKHFSGAHYVARAEFIANLPDALSTKYMNFNSIGGFDGVNCHCAELWLSLAKDGRFKSLINSGFNWTERQRSIDEFIKPYLNNLPKEEQYWL